MARVASTSTAIVLPRLQPYSFRMHNQSPGHLNFWFHLQNRNYRFAKLCSQTNPDTAESATSEEKQVVEPGFEIDSRTAVTAVSETAQPASPGFPE